MACSGLPFCPAYSFAINNYRLDFKDLAGWSDRQEALTKRFFTAISLLNESRALLLSKNPTESDLQRVIDQLDSFYQLSQSPGAVIVSRRCHNFFFNYLESVLFCLLVAQKIQLAGDPDEVALEILLLNQRFERYAFTDLCGILKTMHPQILPPDLTALPTTFIPEVVENPFDPRS